MTFIFELELCVATPSFTALQAVVAWHVPQEREPKKTANVKKEADVEPKTKLEPIHGVSDADVEEAKESLKAEGEAKRCRSLMVSYLLSKGQKDAYDALPLPLRKEFMWQYHAMKIRKRTQRNCSRTPAQFLQ